MAGSCSFIAEQVHPRAWRHTCRYCGHSLIVEAENYRSNRACQSPDAPDKQTQIAMQANGPGSYLIQVTHELGFKEKDGCGCNSLAGKMNRWGVAACRGEHREEILQHLRKRAAEAGWIETALAGAKTLLRLKWYDPRDPAPGMLEEACQRSEAALEKLSHPSSTVAKSEES